MLGFIHLKLRKVHRKTTVVFYVNSHQKFNLSNRKHSFSIESWAIRTGAYRQLMSDGNWYQIEKAAARVANSCPWRVGESCPNDQLEHNNFNFMYNFNDLLRVSEDFKKNRHTPA